MKIEDQVCSLEHAKRFKEFGVTADSVFCYIGDSNPDPKYNVPHDLYYTENANSEVGKSWFDARVPAYTVSELGFMLPDEFFMHFHFPGHLTLASRHYLLRFNGWFFTAKGKRIYGCRYDHKGDSNIATENFYGTEAEAKAGLIIHLLENKLITVEQINKQLI